MAGKIRSQPGSKNHQQQTGGRRPSDSDTGYLWGEAGQKMHEKRTRPRGYLWSDKNRAKAK